MAAKAKGDVSGEIMRKLQKAHEEQSERRRRWKGKGSEGTSEGVGQQKKPAERRGKEAGTTSSPSWSSSSEAFLGVRWVSSSDCWVGSGCGAQVLHFRALTLVFAAAISYSRPNVWHESSFLCNDSAAVTGHRQLLQSKQMSTEKNQDGKYPWCQLRFRQHWAWRETEQLWDYRRWLLVKWKAWPFFILNCFIYEDKWMDAGNVNINKYIKEGMDELNCLCLNVFVSHMCSKG